MIEMSAVKDWRAVAVQIMHDPGRTPFTVPVGVEAVFRFARPKSHYRANGDLKESAPYWHPSSPDLDKLARALGDALTVAGVVADDRLIASWAATRVWAEVSSATVRVKPLSL